MPSRTKFDKSDEMIAERRQGTGKMPDDMPKMDGIYNYKY